MTMSKHDILEQLARTHTDAIAELTPLDPQRVIYAESGWRVKDIVGHIVTWEAEYLRALHTHRRGGEYAIDGYTDDDHFNGYAATQRMDEPIERFYDEWHALRDWLLILVRPLTDDQLEAELLFPDHMRASVRYLLIELLEHTQEHLIDIRAALDHPPEMTHP